MKRILTPLKASLPAALHLAQDHDQTASSFNDLLLSANSYRQAFAGLINRKH